MHHAHFFQRVILVVQTVRRAKAGVGALMSSDFANQMGIVAVLFSGGSLHFVSVGSLSTSQTLSRCAFVCSPHWELTRMQQIAFLATSYLDSLRLGYAVVAGNAL